VFEFLIHVAIMACLYGLLALSLNLQVGFGGLVNFGQVILFGCGTYGASIAFSNQLGPVAGIALGVIFALVVAVAFARLGRNLGADYWGIATLAVAEVLRILANNEAWLTGGAQGVGGIPLIFGDVPRPLGPLMTLGLCIVLLFVAWWLCNRLTTSRYGLALKLMREEPQLAASLGIELHRFDMSEYMEKHSVARLIGAPPGYVGYEEGGQLSEHVRRKPYSVVLFDEVEKAHPDVMNLLLQILEEGTVTDSLGRKIDFRNTIIIMTSNVGASSIKRQTSLGFGAMTEDQADFEGMKEKILEESKRYFKPEFLNRLDDLVVFHMLEKVDLNQIVDLEVSKLVKRLAEKEIALTLTSEARDFLSAKGFDPAYGARPMRRAVERFLEDPLAEALLRGDVKPSDNVNVVKKADAEELAFISSRSEPHEEAKV